MIKSVFITVELHNLNMRVKTWAYQGLYLDQNCELIFVFFHRQYRSLSVSPMLSIFILLEVCYSWQKCDLVEQEND